MWDATEVEVWVTRSFDNVLIIQWCFLKSGDKFSITNVYAPCDSGHTQVLWTRLGGLINNNKESFWCVNGDFKAICSSYERRSWISVSRKDNFSHFNQFIDENILFWYSGNGLITKTNV